MCEKNNSANNSAVDQQIILHSSNHSELKENRQIDLNQENSAQLRNWLNYQTEKSDLFDYFDNKPFK